MRNGCSTGKNKTVLREQVYRWLFSRFGCICSSCVLSRRVFYIFLQVLGALVLMHRCQMACFPKRMRQYILHHRQKRLADKERIKQQQVICRRMFH